MTRREAAMTGAELWCGNAMAIRRDFYPNEGAEWESNFRRTACRVGCRKRSGVRPIHLGEVLDVREINRGPHDIGKGQAEVCEDILDDLDATVSLGENVTGDDLARDGIAGCLARDKDEVAGNDRMRVRTIGTRNRRVRKGVMIHLGAEPIGWELMLWRPTCAGSRPRVC